MQVCTLVDVFIKMSGGSVDVAKTPVRVKQGFLSYLSVRDLGVTADLETNSFAVCI